MVGSGPGGTSDDVGIAMAEMAGLAGRWVEGGRSAVLQSRIGREALDLAALVTDGLFYALPLGATSAIGGRPKAAIVLGFDWLRVATVDGGGQVRGRGPRLPLDASPERLADNLWAAAGNSPGPVAVLFAEDACLTHELRLPPAPRRLLDPLIANLSAERSPFGAGEALCAWTLRARDHEGLAVEACTIDRSLAEPVLGRLAAAGIAIGAVGRLTADAERIDWLSRPAWAGLAHPSPWSALKPLRRPLRRAGGLAALVLVAALLNLAYTLAARGWFGDEADQALAAARAAAVLHADRDRLDVARRAGLARVHLLDDIAERLPDDAWLEGARFGAGEVDLSVVAASASVVLRALAGTPGLRDLALKGAVTQDPATRRDRFRLGATVAGHGVLRAGLSP